MVRVREKFLQQITLLAKDGYGIVDASMARIVNAADPIDPQDLATKDYVDSSDAFTVDSVNDLRSLTGSGRSSTQVKYHTTDGDDGGGIFDRYPVGSYVDNDGTYIVAGTNVWIRRDSEIGSVKTEWWGTGKADDTAAFIRALAYSVGTTYAAWIAGNGDTTWAPSHITRPVVYTNTVTLTSEIVIRYRGVQIQGPCQYGDGFVPDNNQLLIKHDGYGFRIDTGATVSPSFTPSLSLRGVNLYRHASNRTICLDGIYIDGVNWFRGLAIEDSNVFGHRSGIGLAAAYAASITIASGLCINRSGLTNNREYGIDTGTVVQWDLSDIRDSGLNHNTLGPMRMVIAGGSIDRIDIEGGGGGGYIVGRGAKLGSFYVEQTGPLTVPAITVQAVNSILTPNTTADGRPASYQLKYSENCTITDRLPIRLHGCTQCDAQSGWSPTDLSTDLHFMASHCPERAQYLKKELNINGSLAATTYKDDSKHTTFRFFNGIELPACEVGTLGTPLNAQNFTIPYTITSGHTYMIAYCVQYPETQTNYYSHVSYIGIGSDDTGQINNIPNGGCYQHVFIFTAASSASSISAYIWPYSTGTSDDGYGAAISPFYITELPTGITTVDQLHVPTLIKGTSAIGQIHLLDRSGTNDVSDQLQAALNELGKWETLKLPHGTYRITKPLLMPNKPNGGYTILGDGGMDQSSIGTTTILADFYVPSGLTATITGTTPHNPAKDSRAVVVTMTGLTNLTNVEPGDTLWISNATLERNNGSFTLMSVYPDDGYVTYFGYNHFVHVTSAEWRPTEIGETNNGSLHWEIRKPMIRLYTRDVSFENLKLDGGNTAGAIVDSSITGANGTPTTAIVNTANKFIRCFITRGIQGIKVGDFSGYATGGCTDIEWVNNCDLHVIRECMIHNLSHSCFFVPNATSNSMQHAFYETSLQYAQMGICFRRASFHGHGVNFTGNTGADVYLEFIAEPCSLRGGGSEISPRFLVLGVAGYMAGSDGAYPFIVDGFRCGPSNLPADNCYIQTSQIGGLSLRNCNFSFTPGDFTIGAYGYTTQDNERQISMTIEGCIFPCATPDTIVTAMTGVNGLFPVWYYSMGNTVMQDPTNTARQCPNGIIAAYGNPASNPQAPMQQILQLVTPSYGITTLVNGANNNLTNPYRTSVTAKGPTAAVILNGIAAGEDGQRLKLRLKYNYQTTISHLSGSATGKPIMTPLAADIVLPAPGASPAYNMIELEYVATENGGTGAWVLQ